MHEFSAVKTTLITLLATSITSSLIALPLHANQANFRSKSSNYELAYNHRFSDDRLASNYREPTNNFKQIIGITFLALGTGVITWYLTRSYQPSFVNSLPSIHRSNSSLLDRISPKLRQQLLRLVHNPQIANRLLSGALDSHPSRSPNWLAEKVIYDLQRDRS